MTSPATTYLKRPELNAVEMDGELVMMGQEQGEYYGLRDVAASIWTYLEAPKSLEELVVLVSAEWNVSPDAATAAKLSAGCHQAGVLTLTCGTYGNVLRFLPPLVAPDALLHEAMDVLAEVASGL